MTNEAPVPSARQTLHEIIKSYEEVEERVAMYRKSNDDQEEQIVDSGSIKCYFCGKNIDPLSFLVSLPCCGQITHINCIAHYKGECKCGKNIDSNLMQRYIELYNAIYK